MPSQLLAPAPTGDMENGDIENGLPENAQRGATALAAARPSREGKPGGWGYAGGRAGFLSASLFSDLRNVRAICWMIISSGAPGADTNALGHIVPLSTYRFTALRSPGSVKCTFGVRPTAVLKRAECKTIVEKSRFMGFCLTNGPRRKARSKCAS